MGIRFQFLIVQIALSSLCLSFLKMLLDPMQVLVEKKFSVKAEIVGSQMNLARNELQNHVNNIQDKIVSILRDRYRIIDVSLKM